MKAVLLLLLAALALGLWGALDSGHIDGRALLAVIIWLIAMIRLYTVSEKS